MGGSGGDRSWRGATGRDPSLVIRQHVCGHGPEAHGQRICLGFVGVVHGPCSVASRPSVGCLGRAVGGSTWRHRV